MVVPCMQRLDGNPWAPACVDGGMKRDRRRPSCRCHHRFVPRSRNRRKTLGLRHTRAFVNRIFGMDMHAMRVLSLANGVGGVLTAAVLSVHGIGQAYARLARTTPKAGVKQVDRMLSNVGIEVDAVMRQWARYVVGTQPRVPLACPHREVALRYLLVICRFLERGHLRRQSVFSVRIDFPCIPEHRPEALGRDGAQWQRRGYSGGLRRVALASGPMPANLPEAL